MAVTSQQVRVAHSGNGATLAFAVPWYFLYPEALLVVLRITATGDETIQVLTTAYTVAGEGVSSGGTVTFLAAPATGTEVHIIHDPDLLQRMVLVSGAVLPVLTVEKTLDDIVHQQQRTRDLVDRAPTLGATDVDGDGAFQARENRIADLADPVEGQDAVTKAYALANFATASGPSALPPAGSLTNAMWDTSSDLLATNVDGLTAAEMAVETDPYPGAVLSPSTDLLGAWQRIQYQLLNLLNWLDGGARTHAYDDVPVSTLPATVAAQIAAALSAAATSSNVLLNGSLLIAQRQPSESATGTIAVGSEAFVCDRWSIQPLGAGTITWNRTTAAGKRNSTSKSYIGLEVVGAAGITGVRFQTRLSSRQCRALGFGAGVAKNMTFGCKVRHSGTTGSITPTFTVKSTANELDGANNKFSTAAAAKTIRSGPTSFGAPAPLSSAQEMAFTVTVDFGSMTDAQNGVELMVDLGVLSAATIKCTISDIWLAAADISSTLLVDNFYDHIYECKRHYQKTFNYSDLPSDELNSNSALVMTTGASTAGSAAFQWDHVPPLMFSGISNLTTIYSAVGGAGVGKVSNGATHVTPSATTARNERTRILFTATGGVEEWVVQAAVDAEWYD